MADSLNSPERPRYIFHVTNLLDWVQAQRAGDYRSAGLGRTLEQQGFIHASHADQVSSVGNSLFRGAQNLVLLVIDTRRVTAEIRYEPARTENTEAQRVVREVSYESPAAEGELFPHIYGPLNLDAVVGVLRLEPGFDGTFRFPQRQYEALRL